MIAETFVALLAAHLVADFLGQNEWMIREKNRPHVLAVHVLIVLLATLAAIGTAWTILLVTALTHAAFDAAKIRFDRNGAVGFALDQGAHIAVAAALAIWIPIDFSNHYLIGLLPADQRHWVFAGLALASGTIATVIAGGYLIGMMMVPYTPAAATGQPATMPGAGAMIGRLERLLILILVLSGQPQGVGFLVAAKSILRFGEVTASEPGRHVAEYVIIGTLLSFAWGIGCSYLTHAGIGLWLPAQAASGG
ncbi:MAG: DUF3307 domain-containing protein [Rhizobiaceae bacterium]|nr:DUF3307 domain-containing protein [Rhizobiaceae bacterium]MCV0407367.1 DUF3307 domain-containing protein [Rhizobiaceae bacterium]